ncbi:hypothetical protein HYH02_004903 [Chlamydomonas schloesseri]|uniref:SHSP domain-containing protein n=1 Tax=Chlamydomonas schloesseri TaxID=2026947 RepID=A0A835WMV1_9CHLO|nr:hypothetical protein HYH02_004903 [Chlamydomonas schloesseri]|eukprot:KAG2450400.1 hypothetical protein HYH02_004903 [Chlamydomonas schloesseri]
MSLISLFSEPIFDTELLPLGFASEDAHRHALDRHSARKRGHSHDRDLLAPPGGQDWNIIGPTAPMDIVETATAYELHADAPGMGPAEISGARKSLHEANKEARGRLLRRERTAYSFSRAFSLPENANPDGITASMDKGVLVVTVPKRPRDSSTSKPPAPKRIAVAAQLAQQPAAKL